MYKEQESLCTLSSKALDFLLVGIAMFATNLVVQKYFPTSYEAIIAQSNYWSVVVISFFVYHVCFIFFGYYKTFRNQTVEQMFSKTMMGLAAGTAIMVTVFFLLNIQEFNRSVVGTFFIFSTVVLTISRSLSYFIVGHFHKKGFNHKNVLVVGSKTRAAEMIAAIISNPSTGYRIFGCLEIEQKDVGKIVGGKTKVIGTLEKDFQEILLNNTIDELVFALPLNKIKKGSVYVSFAEEIGINIRVLPDWQILKMAYRPETASIYYDQFIGLPTIALSSIPQKETELLLKKLLDYIGSAVLFVALLPVMILTVIVVKITSPGPVFYKQLRCGLNGRKFMVYKFRSMVVDADRMKDKLVAANESDGPTFKMKDDPRLTPIGKFIRSTSIDELPQLINVLKGDMSLVGPRPPLPDEVSGYKPWHRRRLSMKPGLTCIWQVKARNGTSFEEWMKLDLEYIDNWSLMLDVKLLLLTIPTVFAATGR